MFAVTVQSVSIQQVNWTLVKDSDFRQFYCSLCDKCFKRKYAVESHFKRCADKLGLNFPGREGVKP